MDGTKRTAFAATLYFLSALGYQIPERLPVDEAIEFCASLAEENLRRAQGEPIKARTIEDIELWLKKLLGGNSSD
jgi:prophage maintenance system killer protein